MRLISKHQQRRLIRQSPLHSCIILHVYTLRMFHYHY